MKLVLSLSPDKNVWALSNPDEAKSYISYRKEKGIQETILIFTSNDRGPKEIELEDYPGWAKRMILSSIIVGELINEGEPIGQANLKEVSQIKDENEVEEPPKKKAKANRTKKKTGKSKNKSSNDKG